MTIKAACGWHGIRVLATAMLGGAITAFLGVTAAQGQTLKVLRPATQRPAPAVILVPGCTGFSSFGGVNSYDEKAQELQKAGYVVVFADYLRLLGQKDCTTTTHAKAAGSVMEAANWLRSQRDVDQRRISAIGWSFGGGILLSIMAEKTSAPFRKAALLYPDCRNARAIQSGTSVLMFLAGLDDVTPGARCAGVTAQGGDVRTTTYPSARHGFDARGLPAAQRYSLGTLGYDAPSAAAAWAEIYQFLR